MLSDLCDRLGYDQDAATEVHKGIYTERIETFLEDSKISGAAGHWSVPQAPQQQLLLLPAASVGLCSLVLPSGCGLASVSAYTTP